MNASDPVQPPRRLRRALARCFIGEGRRKAKPIKPVCSRRALDALLMIESFARMHGAKA